LHSAVSATATAPAPVVAPVFATSTATPPITRELAAHARRLAIAMSPLALALSRGRSLALVAVVLVRRPRAIEQLLQRFQRIGPHAPPLSAVDHEALGSVEVREFLLHERARELLRKDEPRDSDGRQASRRIRVGAFLLHIVLDPHRLVAHLDQGREREQSLTQRGVDPIGQRKAQRRGPVVADAAGIA